jgi:glutamate synthase domain-containing protein 2
MLATLISVLVNNVCCRFCDFEVCHHYLQTNSPTLQSRLRKRGRKGKWSYMNTIRKQVRGYLHETSKFYRTTLSDGKN